MNAIGSAGVVNFLAANAIYLTAATTSLTWGASATAALAQVSISSATNGANMLFTPQQSTQATNNGPGSAVFAFAAVNGSANEGQLQITRGGTLIFAAGAATGIGAGNTYVWVQPSGTPTSGNYTFRSDGANAYLNAAGGNVSLMSSNSFCALLGTCLLYTSRCV